MIDFGAGQGDGWEPFDPVLQPAPGAAAHEITLHATEERLEIAPGVRQAMWTFNGQVPGPVLRGKIGDLFTITLVNDGKNGHSIDFHASEVAPDDEMRTIGPGESLYPFLTHKLASAEKGAIGYFQAGELRNPSAGGATGH